MVASLLRLAVALRGLRMSLPVVLLVAGMGSPPLLAAVTHDLAVLEIGLKFPAVIVTVAATLAVRLAADPLLGTIEGKWEELLAVGTAAEVAQVRLLRGSFQNELLRRIETIRELQCRNCCRVLHRLAAEWGSQARHHWLRLKPAKTDPFPTGAKRLTAQSMNGTATPIPLTWDVLSAIRTYP